MTLSLPWTFTGWDDLDQATLRSQLQDVLDAIAQQFPVSLANVVQVPQARVYNSANISLTNNTPTALTFDSERYDTDGIHDTGANTSRLTCITSGLYSIGAHVEFAANATGYRQAFLRLNGTTAIGNLAVPAVAGGIVTQLSVGTDYRLAAGDYVEVVVTQTSGGALNANASANFSPEFFMHWVSP